MEDTSSPDNGFIRWCIRNPVEFFAGLLCAALTTVVFLQVLFRYALQFPLDWAEELAMFLFQWVAFIGAGVAVRHRFHFSVDLITNRLPHQLQKSIGLLASAAVFSVAYIMIHVGINMMEAAVFITLPVMKFSKAYVYLAIPVGGLLMIVYQIPIVVQQLRNLRENG
jgi:TRAP-type C4-dicarboxylate transport system permease small subunit